jgi:predicted nucleic acid-binding Zn ribbon protein
MKDFPKLSDWFECKQCGMRLEILEACFSDDPANVHFTCCNKAMVKTKDGDADASTSASAAPSP